MRRHRYIACCSHSSTQINVAIDASQNHIVACVHAAGTSYVSFIGKRGYIPASFHLTCIDNIAGAGFCRYISASFYQTLTIIFAVLDKPVLCNCSFNIAFGFYVFGIKNHASFPDMRCHVTVIGIHVSREKDTACSLLTIILLGSHVAIFGSNGSANPDGTFIRRQADTIICRQS